MLPAILSGRGRLLRWTLLLAIIILVATYQFGPAPWIHDDLGDGYHFAAEILFYGAAGSALTTLLLDFRGRWLEERATSELQAQVLAHARELTRTSRELSDEALQALFAASTIVTALKLILPDLPPRKASALHEAEQALDRAIQQLHSYLQNQPALTRQEGVP